MSADVQHGFRADRRDSRQTDQLGGEQTTSAIVMVRPALFRLNFDTALDNAYQQKPDDVSVEEFEALAKSRDGAFAAHPGLSERVEAHDRLTHGGAIVEFDAMVELLRSKMINVVVVPGVLEHDSPDEVFPNNPLSLHAENGGTSIKYPMAKVSRRREVELPIVENLRDKCEYEVAKVIDLSGLIDDGRFVEGTGSMVLDRRNKIAYASLSQRTTPGGVEAFAKAMGYQSVTFTSVDCLHKAKNPDGTDSDKPMDVYHANVVMSVGEGFAVVCLEAIDNEVDRARVLTSLQATGKEVIEITTGQMNGFAGNILEVRDRDGNPIIVMSQTAYDAFTEEQRRILGKYGEMVAVSIPTIEKNGGGSARCMMLEVHLPKQERR